MMEFIEKVEKEINYIFPQDYKKYLLDKKPLKISNNILKLSNSTEKVVRHLFSLEPENINYILKFQKFDSKLCDSLIPFAICEFGDLICFNRTTDDIFIYNLEEDAMTFVSTTFDKFINSMVSEKK